MTERRERYTRWLADLGSDDVPLVGGKNASLGEMTARLKDQGISVPDGFATTASGYWEFVEANDLRGGIQSHLDDLAAGRRPLAKVGECIRQLFLQSEFPEPMAEAIRSAYRELSVRCGSQAVHVAVRSSATAEDLPDASFAGQQETFLNISGEEALLDACRKCYASLFTDRAISYREQKGFDHMKVALSVGVQKMIRSDKASAGVMFSIDTETGFPDAVVINAAWGLGELVVQGEVTPDEYVVFKPPLRNQALSPIIGREIAEKRQKMIYASGAGATTRIVRTTKAERHAPILTGQEILQLARWACTIEQHYGLPMDMEWAKDGETGELHIVQARPETVQSRREPSALTAYSLKQQGKRLLSGLSIGDAIASGKAIVLEDASAIGRFKAGCILVTGSTNPDWVPIMKKAAGIVTDRGGRTSHAAIVSRELGIPAIVGTENGTSVLGDGQEITISCAEGDEGHVYEGVLEFEKSEVNLEDIPKIRTQIMMNIATPAAAFSWWRLPCRGIGLARMEFIINTIIKAHPMALLRFDELADKGARRQIEKLTASYTDKAEYFVDRLARGIARIAASQYPDAVIVRMSDFKTNEYAGLIGGKQFEPVEENPMLGFRGASRYYSSRYGEGFALECLAVKRARQEMGLTNIVPMIPFCRTIEEAKRVLAVMGEHGLRRGEDGLEVYVMAEIPSNVVMAHEFAEYFDGFSIGSNDLTQLVLGVDRDSADLAYLFDERNEAVKRMIASLISQAHKAGRKVGICGQAPSDYPEFAAWLVEAGIDSISLNPDSVVQTIRVIAEAEKSRVAQR